MVASYVEQVPSYNNQFYFWWECIKSGMKKTKRCSGFSLIEIMIALAVIGLAVTLALLYQRKVESTVKVLESVSAITNMTSKIKSYYAAVGSYSGLTSERVHAMGLVVPPLTWDGVYIYDASGHTMSIWGNAAGAAPTFVISVGKTTTPVPSYISMTIEECIGLATELASGADRVNVGSWVAITDTNGLAGGGKAYKAAGNVISMTNLTDAAGCGATSPAIVLQYH
jgi:prepilin-type N-terminal cleavage/methylation domain-containing protein